MKTEYRPAGPGHDPFVALRAGGRRRATGYVVWRCSSKDPLQNAMLNAIDTDDALTAKQNTIWREVEAAAKPSAKWRRDCFLWYGASGSAVLPVAQAKKLYEIMRETYMVAWNECEREDRHVQR